MVRDVGGSSRKYLSKHLAFHKSICSMSYVFNPLACKCACVCVRVYLPVGVCCLCVHLFVWSYAAEHVTVICFGVCVSFLRVAECEHICCVSCVM